MSNSLRSKAFWSLLRPHRGRFLLGMAFLLLGVGTNLLVPMLLRQLVDQSGFTFLQKRPTEVAFLFVTLFAFQAVFFHLRAQTFGVMGATVAATLRARVFAKILGHSVAEFDSSRTGDLVSRISSDTQAIQDAVSIQLSVVSRYGIQVLAGVVLMTFIAPVLAVLVVVALAILAALSFILGRKLRAASRAQQQAVGDASTVAHEVFGNIRVVKAFDQGAFELTRFEAVNNRVLNLAFARTRISAFFQSFVTFLLHSSLVLIVLVGVHKVSAGSLSSGDLTAFLAYGVIVAVSFAFLAGSYAEFNQALGITDRVFELLNKPEEPQTRAIAKSISLPVQGSLLFHDVHFAYPSRAADEVLRGVSFSANPGEKVALVGPSGAGKSTIAALALRFYDPNSGIITFDGIDLRDLLPGELRKHIAFVPQQPELFGGTIRENILYGKPDASEQQIREVSQRAALLEFIDGLPHGFDTIVGERGIQLSGGQKQRIAIARAMLRNPKLLILDEATSALDSENEHLVQQALAELMVGRTALIIAHRLATVQDCDKVVVLESGLVLQEGTHRGLSSTPGLYQQYVSRQSL